MRVRDILVKTTLVALVICVFSSPAFAANTGSVSGLVADENGAGVPGALVVVKGANLFATSSSDGYFVINGVPVGTYDVKASRVGYSEMTSSGVRVMSDLRTNVSFSINSTIVGTVTIVAETPDIIMDETTTTRTVGSEDFDTQVSDDFQDMLLRTPGIVTENFGEGTRNLHIRGGRGEEIAYIVDGVNITNPIVGGSGMEVPTDAIEEMNIITAGWDAEYGEAQSGIINITTKEGRENFTGSVSYTHEVFTAIHENESHKYLESTGVEDPDVPLVSWTTSTRAAKLQKIQGSFGGPLIGKYAGFYLSGDWTKDWTVQPIPDPDVTYNANAKFTFKPSPKYRITLTGGKYSTEQDLFENQYQYVLDPHYLHDYTTSWRASAAWAHYVSDSAFYTLTGAYFFEHSKVWVQAKESWYPANDLNHPEGYICLPQQTDPTGWFYTYGDEAYWRDRYQNYSNVKGDFTLDIGSVGEGQTLQQNQLKAGFDVKIYDLDYFDVQPFPSNVYYDDYEVQPRTYSGFAQDKIEYSGMIMNIGLRFDMFDPNCEFAIDPYDYRVDKYGNPVMSDSEYETFHDTPTETAESTYQVSPRIGISYPITDRDKLHFSYGHFFQTPPFRYLYMSTQVEPDGAYPIIGNPNVNPQKTVQYEMGVEHVFSDGLKTDVSVYFKDIKDLIDTERINYPTGQNYTRVINADFGSVRGLEVSVQSQFLNYFSGNLGYTFSVAKGLASAWSSGYMNAYRGRTAPNRENRLDWDQTHTLNASIDFRTNSFGVNSTVNYGSGMPYNAPRSGTGQPVINTERMPWTINWNARANYDIHLIGMDYQVFAEFLNILNRRNVYNFGSDEGDDSGSDWTPYYHLYDDPDGPYDDMEVYGDPFRLRVGASVGF